MSEAAHQRLSGGALLSLVVMSLLLWAAVASVCLLVGSTSVGIPRGANGEIAASVLWTRAEVVLLASGVGAALASAGVVYQAVLRNPLADPYLLGVASGATLGSVLWRVPMWTMLPLVGALGQQSAALVGALGAVAVVFACASRRGRLEPVTLLLVGVIVSSICGAVLLLLLSLRPELTAAGGGGGAASILIGSLQTNLTYAQQLTALAVVVGGWAAMMALSGELGVASLSDAEAESMGVRVVRLRWVAMGVASVVVAAAVAVSGPIGFVGLICPHVGRLLVGPDPRRLLPVATALGAALLAVADAACRLGSQPGLLGTVLPVGVVTAMLGGPFFLLLLVRERRGEAA